MCIMRQSQQQSFCDVETTLKWTQFEYICTCVFLPSNDNIWIYFPLIWSEQDFSVVNRLCTVHALALVTMAGCTLRFIEQGKTYLWGPTTTSRTRTRTRTSYWSAQTGTLHQLWIWNYRSEYLWGQRLHDYHEQEHLTFLQVHIDWLVIVSC